MRLKTLIASILLSLPFWWGVNVFASKTESLFFDYISQNQKAFRASAVLGIENIKRTENPYNLEIKAKAAGSFLILPDKSFQYLYKKNISEKLPIASLTKLMMADIVLENFDHSKDVVIKKEIFQKDVLSNFKAKEIFAIKDLLYSALIESNNVAVLAISDEIGESNFVSLMNLEAKYLGMNNTFFANSTGLDPELNADFINLSTVSDLVKLAEHIIKNPEIKDILSQKEFDLYTKDGKFHHKAITTNEFLKSGLFFEGKEMFGAKTGQTIKAGECLLLILKVSKNNGYLINVVLGSDDRFGDMKKIIRWADYNFDL